MDQPLPDFPSHELLIVSSKYSKNWVRGVNMKSYVSPNIECTLNRGNYEAKTRLLHSTVQTSKCPHRFWERDPEIVRTCSMCPCRAFDTLIFFIFLAGYVCSLNTQISPTIKKIPNIWRNITKKCICHLLGRGKINMCANFSGTIHQNRRGYWTLKDFGVICVNQPVRVGAYKYLVRFQWVMPQVNSVGCHIRRLLGNRKTRPKRIARPGCLFASRLLAFFSFSCQGYTDNQTQCSVSDTHCAYNSRHLCSNIRSYNRVGVLVENVSRFR